jgi:hypothetical protein
MKKTLFFLLISVSVFAQTGIGTTAPINKLEVVTSTADPATSGSSANGNLRLGGTSGSHILDFGLSSSSTYGWVQARSKSNYSTIYSLAFNPNGGNVGIGTASPSSTLTVGNAGGTIAGEITLNPNSTQYEGGQINIKKSLIGSTADWIIDQYGTSSADARLRIFNSINEVNGMAILENGNLGVSNLTPTDKLVVGSAFSLHDGGDKVIGLGWSPGSNKTILAGVAAEIRLNPTNGRLSFGIDPSSRTLGAAPDVQRRMTISSSGNVGVGTETPGSKLHVSGADNTTIYVQSSTSDNNGMVILNATTNQNWSSGWHEFMLFQNQGTTVGYIGAATGGNGVVYSTTSDYRLKTDARDYSGLDVISKIKTYDYAWKKDNARMYGVMAHELQSILPYAVAGQKDAVDSEGKIIPQGVDYGKLTPILIKAIQEQESKIHTLEQRILNLERMIQKKRK